MAEPRKTQAQQAYEIIRGMIIRCEFRPGEMLTEAVLTEATGFGHTPIRDAVQWLGHEGLVDVNPRRGTFVSSLNLDDVQQIFDLRIAMESVVAGQAIARVASSALDAMDEVIARVESADDEGSDSVADRMFHEALLDLTGNRYLVAIYSSLHDSSMRLFYLTRCPMESRSSQLRTLKGVRAALAARDQAALEEFLIEHVRDFRRRVGGAITS
jgi:DNA-binding GntR family transcriptional regulator